MKLYFVLLLSKYFIPLQWHYFDVFIFFTDYFTLYICFFFGLSVIEYFVQVYTGLIDRI